MERKTIIFLAFCSIATSAPLESTSIVPPSSSRTNNPRSSTVSIPSSSSDNTTPKSFPKADSLIPTYSEKQEPIFVTPISTVVQASTGVVKLVNPSDSPALVLRPKRASDKKGSKKSKSRKSKKVSTTVAPRRRFSRPDYIENAEFQHVP